MQPSRPPDLTPTSPYFCSVNENYIGPTVEIGDRAVLLSQTSRFTPKAGSKIGVESGGSKIALLHPRSPRSTTEVLSGLHPKAAQTLGRRLRGNMSREDGNTHGSCCPPCVLKCNGFLHGAQNPCGVSDGFEKALHPPVPVWPRQEKRLPGTGRKASPRNARSTGGKGAGHLTVVRLCDRAEALLACERERDRSAATDKSCARARVHAHVFPALRRKRLRAL